MTVPPYICIFPIIALIYIMLSVIQSLFFPFQFIHNKSIATLLNEIFVEMSIYLNFLFFFLFQTVKRTQLTAVDAMRKHLKTEIITEP